MSADRIEYVAGEKDAGRQMKSILRRELGLSSSLVKRLKWRGAFLVDGEPAHTDRMVLPGSVITVRLDEDAPEFPPEDGPLDILWEDEALLAVDKPAGLLMHPSFYRITGTLANFVSGYYRRTGQACAVHPWPTASPGITPPRARSAPSTRSAAWTGTPSAWCCWRKTPTSTPR